MQTTPRSSSLNKNLESKRFGFIKFANSALEKKPSENRGFREL
jgi:hypothetical protein